MTRALVLPMDTLVGRAWLAVMAAILFATFALTAALGGASTVATINEAAPMPAMPAAAPVAEEPWAPGVMTFSGERTPTDWSCVIMNDAPNCICAGF